MWFFGASRAEPFQAATCGHFPLSANSFGHWWERFRLFRGDIHSPHAAEIRQGSAHPNAKMADAPAPTDTMGKLPQPSAKSTLDLWKTSAATSLNWKVLIGPERDQTETKLFPSPETAT